MTLSSPAKNDRIEGLRRALRDARRKYDALDRGKTAPLRRCRMADDVAMDGAYWGIGGELARKEKYLPHVVLLFPLAPHVTRDAFAFGRYLRSEIGDSDGAILRFRRLLDSRDRDELDHRLRAILKLASRGNAPVDWGILGTDILWFFAESGNVRRRWAQEFYSHISET